MIKYFKNFIKYFTKNFNNFIKKIFGKNKSVPVAALSLVAKLAALGSVLIYQAYFGLSHPQLKIYAYSINIPNYLFTALGASLTGIVVPIYAGLDKKRGGAFLNALITSVAALSAAAAGAAILLAPVIVGFTDYAGAARDYAVFAVRVLAPVMFFYALRDIFAGALQSRGRFYAVALVSAPGSAIIAAYTVLGAGRFGVTGLIYATLIGFSLQAFILAPGVAKTGYRFKPDFKFFKNPDLLRGAKLIPPVLLGVCAYQINMLFNNNMATAYGTENITNTVLNVTLIPILTLIYSITAIYYPKLSAAASGAANGAANEEFKARSAEIISSITCFTAPAMVGLYLLRFEIMKLLIFRGAVTIEETILAGEILGIYSLSVAFVGIKEALDKIFYERKQAAPSGIAGVVIMVSNAAFQFLLRKRLGAHSLPAAYALSSFLGSGALFFWFAKKIGIGKIYLNLLKFFACACIMGLAITAIKSVFNTDGFFGNAAALFTCVLGGAAVYFALIRALKVEVKLL